MTATDTLHLRIDGADGSLQRLIGLVERRGFHIDGLTLVDEGASRRVAIAVRGRDASRCPDILGRHIDKLFGVTRVIVPFGSGPQTLDERVRSGLGPL